LNLILHKGPKCVFGRRVQNRVWNSAQDAMDSPYHESPTAALDPLPESTRARGQDDANSEQISPKHNLLILDAGGWK
jgi:hypothetical protein